MNTLETRPGPLAEAAAPPDWPHAPLSDPLLLADWRDFVFLHFSVPAETLAPHVPGELDLRGGRAWISLVHFRMERMRPTWLPAPIGRALLRPISDHAFMNVRTYVRGPDGPGIHFLAEWVNNPLSRTLGPLTYGLPYRLATIAKKTSAASGLTRIAVEEKGRAGALNIIIGAGNDAGLRPCVSGTLDDFLLERYVATTRRGGMTRYFHVAHEPWRVARLDLVRFDTTLVENVFPWFRGAEFAGAHISPGVTDVEMGWPHLVPATTADAPSRLARWVPRLASRLNL